MNLDPGDVATPNRVDVKQNDPLVEVKEEPTIKTEPSVEIQLRFASFPNQTDEEIATNISIKSEVETDNELCVDTKNAAMFASINAICAKCCWQTTNQI